MAAGSRKQARYAACGFARRRARCERRHAQAPRRRGKGVCVRQREVAMRTQRGAGIQVTCRHAEVHCSTFFTFADATSEDSRLRRCPRHRPAARACHARLCLPPSAYSPARRRHLFIVACPTAMAWRWKQASAFFVAWGSRKQVVAGRWESSNACRAARARVLKQVGASSVCRCVV